MSFLLGAAVFQGTVWIAGPGSQGGTVSDGRKLEAAAAWSHTDPKISDGFGFGISSVNRYTCVASSLTQIGAVWRRCVFFKMIGSGSHQETNTYTYNSL